MTSLFRATSLPLSLTTTMWYCISLIPPYRSTSPTCRYIDPSLSVAPLEACSVHRVWAYASGLSRTGCSDRDLVSPACTLGGLSCETDDNRDLMPHRSHSAAALAPSRLPLHRRYHGMRTGPYTQASSCKNLLYRRSQSHGSERERCIGVRCGNGIRLKLVDTVVSCQGQFGKLHIFVVFTKPFCKRTGELDSARGEGELYPTRR